MMAKKVMCLYKSGVAKIFFTLVVCSFWSTTVNAKSHYHGSRSHNHNLPAQQGVNHSHNGGPKGSYKTSGRPPKVNIIPKDRKFAYIDGVKVPLNSIYVIRDQNNCIHYNPKPLKGIQESVNWSGQCVSGYAHGYGVRQWYKNGATGQVEKNNMFARAHLKKRFTPSKAAKSKTKPKAVKLNCDAIDINQEKVACYAVIVGPKVCTEAVSENEQDLTKSYGGRVALAAACTNGVYSAYAKEYVGEDLLWNMADEASESACSNIGNQGFLAKALGVYGCTFSTLSWGLKISTANSCVKNIERQCE